MNGLCAADALKIFSKSIRLLPALAKQGVPVPDALAIAYNATFLYYHLRKGTKLRSPKQVLRRYSLGEIARLCADILAQESIESGFNPNFKEVLP